LASASIAIVPSFEIALEAAPPILVARCTIGAELPHCPEIEQDRPTKAEARAPGSMSLTEIREMSSSPDASE
jgi:hypothetical protein